MNTFIILFRESLEAFLIIGIVYTFLHSLKAHAAQKYVWYGLGAAVLGSIVFGLGLNAIKEQIQNEAYNNLFEGLMMYVAAGFLLYMVVWMAKNTSIASQLKADTQTALSVSASAVFGVVFFAVIREGFETVIFLFASKNMGASGSWLGAILGIGFAAFLGYLIFAQGKKIPLKQFFNVTSVLLIFMAAGMVAYGTHEMEEFLEHKHLFHVVGLTDTVDANGKVIEEAEDKIIRPYDILKPTKEVPANLGMYTEKDGKYYHLFHDKGSIGVYFKAFFGYNSDPNIVEFILWLVVLISGFYLWRNASNPQPKLNS